MAGPAAVFAQSPGGASSESPAGPSAPSPALSPAWPPGNGATPPLLRRLVVGPLVPGATPVAPGGDADEARAARARTDTDAQAHLAQALAATGAFSLQLRADIEPRPPASGLAAFREALAGVDVLLTGTVEVTPLLPDAPASSLPSAEPSPSASPPASTVVSARLSLRAIDPYTGQPFLALGATREGSGRDPALALAAQEVARSLAARLSEMPWQASVMAVDGDRVRLSAGEAQGLLPGMTLEIQTQGDRVRSRRTGWLVTLPGRSVARLQVEGDGVARRVSGSLAGLDLRELVVRPVPSASSFPLSPPPPRNSP